MTVENHRAVVTTVRNGSPSSGADRAESLQQLWSTVRLVTTNFRRQSNHMAGTYDLSNPQLVVFMVVSAGGPMTMGQIGERSDLPASSLTALVDRLGELGLMVREQHPSDRRALQVRLTQAGVDLAYRIARDSFLATAAISENLTDEEIRQVNRTLQKLIDGFEVYAAKVHTTETADGV